MLLNDVEAPPESVVVPSILIKLPNPVVEITPELVFVFEKELVVPDCANVVLTTTCTPASVSVTLSVPEFERLIEPVPLRAMLENCPFVA
jgi:hypothetical protein